VTIAERTLRDWLTALPLIAAGLAVIAFPGELLARAANLAGGVEENLFLAYGFGLILILSGVALALENRAAGERASFIVFTPLTLGIVLLFVVFSAHLSGWWIDDAGITFAYSRSLAEGAGLVAQPGLPAEEGYSSTLWMLILAACRKAGLDIPLAAKWQGVVFSVAAVALCCDIIRRRTGSPICVLAIGAATATAPMVVWGGSGQEHALQALLLTLIVYVCDRTANWRAPVAALLAAYVLVRPEAPIIVVAVFVTGLVISRRDGLLSNVIRNFPLAALPFAVFVGLTAFRLGYFGDPFSNPYYAKTSTASFIGLLNPFGGGWAYVLNGLFASALVVFLPLAALAAMRIRSVSFYIAAAIIVSHLVFVIWAKGDWMGAYRFLMPIIPLMALCVTLAMTHFGDEIARRTFGVAAALIIAQSAVVDLMAFKANPTTPLAVVSDIGQEFAALADRLNIEDPVLAHHDAGGISYHRDVMLIDLGGLVDRKIAKNLENKEFLLDYLVNERRPAFFFGARNFAAATGFAETEAFDAAYVRLEFVGKPYMRSYLTHIRRDLVVQAAGVEPVFADGGEIERVLIR